MSAWFMSMDTTPKLNSFQVGDDSHLAIMQHSQKEFNVCPYLFKLLKKKKEGSVEKEENETEVRHWISCEGFVLN